MVFDWIPFDLAKRSPVFAPKKLDPVASWIQADIRRKKSSNRRVERVVSRQIEEKKMKKKKHTSFLSIEEKQFALAIFAVFSS